MKKIYLQVVFTISSFFIAQFSDAAVYATTATGGNFSAGSTWVGGVAPLSPISGSTVLVYGPLTIDIPLVFNNTTIDLKPSAVVDVNQWVQLFNSAVLVRDGTVANMTTLNVNDEFDLFTSNITLGGQNAMANANNNIGNPCHGPLNLPGNAVGDAANAGIYYSLTGTAPMYTAGSATFDMVLNQFGYGGSFDFPPGNGDVVGQYSINCSGSAPYMCTPGIVYGPADVENQPLIDNSVTPATNFGHNSWQFFTTLPLPVVLVRFAATLNSDNTVALTWTTAEEINFDYFSVERSSDGEKWQTMGQVAAKGHSSGIVDYQYTDQSPFPSANYYRLKMVDLDGKFNYSRVAKVVLQAKPASLVIYSNPFQDMIRLKVNLTTPETLNMKLTDMTGRTFSQQSISGQAGDNFINIKPAGGGSGMYILTIKGQTFNQTVKLVKE